MSNPQFAAEHDTFVRENQRRVSSRLLAEDAYIVCSSGSLRSVAAQSVAENPDTNVLPAEAGGSDDLATKINLTAWLASLGSAHGWGFVALRVR